MAISGYLDLPSQTLPSDLPYLFSSSCIRSFAGLMEAPGILHTGPQGTLGVGEATV